MRVLRVLVVGSLLVLLLLAALPRRAWARAAASLSPHALPDTRHGPRRHGTDQGEGVLAHAGEGGALPPAGREQRQAASHPHGPLHPHQEAPDHRLDDNDEDQDDDDDDDEEEEEEEEEEQEDVEWSAEDLEVIKQKILDGLGLTTPPLRSQVTHTHTHTHGYDPHTVTGTTHAPPPPHLPVMPPKHPRGKAGRGAGVTCPAYP